jgi:hypothetical protein
MAAEDIQSALSAAGPMTPAVLPASAGTVGGGQRQARGLWIVAFIIIFLLIGRWSLFYGYVRFVTFGWLRCWPADRYDDAPCRIDNQPNRVVDPASYTGRACCTSRKDG